MSAPVERSLRDDHLRTRAERVREHRAALAREARIGRVLIYGALILWAFICLFPIYWTITTSFKVAVDVTQGHLIPWVDFQPDWKGWRSLGLSPDTIGETSTVRDEFLQPLREQHHRLARRLARWRWSSARSPPTG